MPELEPRTPRLALQIDAHNSNPARLPQLLAEIAKYGTASVRRAYGNWTSGHLGGWKNGLLDNSIQPIQQFNYTTGKNATDSALIIDAMDLLYSGRLDGFCIASSDSDFTRLAARIREQGLVVYGFGERKTPTAFVAACDKFIYTDLLGDEEGKAPRTAKKTTPTLKKDQKLTALLRKAVDAASDDSGWAQLGAIGSNLQRLAPDFDSRTYGYKKLRDLVQAQGSFDVEERAGADGRTNAVYIRAKN